MFLIIIPIVFAFLYTCYLLTRKTFSISRLALAGGLLACISLEAFDLASMTYPDELGFWKPWTLVAEALLPVFWLLFATTFAREMGLRSLGWIQRGFLLVSWVFLAFALTTPLERFFYSPDFAEERMLFLGGDGYLFYICLVFYLALALYNLEKTLMAQPAPERWRIKLEVLGAGALLSVLLVYYSQALLYRSIDMDLVPVRAFSLGVGVALMWFSSLWQGEARKIRVAKGVAYRSVVVLLIGAYLIGLGLLGEGMRYLGVSTQRSLFIAVAVISGLVVLLVLLSERVRRKIKVALHKNFYQSKYDYREQWLEFTRRLSNVQSRQEQELAVLQFYCETFALQGACLYLFDEDKGEYCPARFYEMRETSHAFLKEHPFIQELAQRDWVFNANEEHPEQLWGTLEFLEQQKASFVVGLQFGQNLEGFVLLGDQVNIGEQLFYEDYDLMKVLGKQATSILLNQRLSAQLSTAREMAAIGKVSAFVMHDLKNLVSNLALVVENAKDYMDDPEFQQDMLETLETTVARMKSLIARLKNMEGKRQLELCDADLKDVVFDSLRMAGGNSVEVFGTSVRACMDITEIQKVILNLVLNARDASDGTQPIRVDVGQSDGMAFVQVADKGCGMSEEFIRTRLFKPFSTTKKKGFGIGLYQCKQVVDAHGGRIEVESQEGEGTTFSVLLPLVAKGNFSHVVSEGNSMVKSAS